MPKIDGKDICNMEDGREVLSSLPNLDKRIKNFLEHLEREPCIHPGNVETWGELKRYPPDYGGCIVISNTRHMCPACRIRMSFFHTVYNAEAYDPSLGEVE